MHDVMAISEEKPTASIHTIIANVYYLPSNVLSNTVKQRLQLLLLHGIHV